MKSFFVLFSRKEYFKPRIYKTMQTIKKYTSASPNLEFKQFLEEKDALMFLEQLSKTQAGDISETTQQSNSTVQHNLNSKEDNNNLQSKLTKSQQNQDKTFSQSEKMVQDLKAANKNLEKILHYFKPSDVSATIDRSETLKGFFDGSSLGVQKFAGAGYHITNERGQNIIKRGEYCGRKTNNQAQFIALLMLLADAYANRISKLHISGDSQLIIRFMTGQYRLGANNLIPYYEGATFLTKYFKTLEFKHLPRENNKLADSLAKNASKAGKKYMII